MKKLKAVAIRPAKKITAEMREQSQIERVTLRREVYQKVGYSDVVLCLQLQYGDEVVLNAFDDSCYIISPDHETYYFYEEAQRKLRAKLKKYGYVRTSCTV